MQGPRPGSIAYGGSLALAALAASACFSDRGVAIEVDVGDTGATTVELYLGTALCDPKTNTAGITCATIAPPPHGEFALPGNVWFRDTLTPEVAEVKGRSATFQLRADKTTTLPIVLAVGMVSDGQATIGVGTAMLHDLAIPIDRARVVTATLQAANPAQPGTVAQDTEDRVLVWRKMTPPSSCVMVEHGGTGSVTRDFVVPAEDPDCDDAVAPECNPAAFLGTNLVGGARSRAECFSSSGGPACVLGAFGCRDNVAGTDNTCVSLAARTCVPQVFCGGCAAFDETCMRDQLSMASTAAARIDCQVPTVAAAGTVSLCPTQAQAMINLDGFFPGGQCPRPDLGALTGLTFDSHHSFDGATMNLSSPTRPCTFAITWTEGTRPLVDPMTDFGIIRFQPDTGPTLLLPVVLHFLAPSQTCSNNDFECSYIGPASESLWTCAP